jgi:hypothetical protein
MPKAESIELTLLPGARAMLDVHARVLPQKDDLCGAFCGALAFAAAGMDERDGEPLDQDAVARAAGSLVSTVPDISILPDGETGRRDYRLTMEFIEDGARSGTTAAGVRSAIESLSEGELAAIPLGGPWTPTSLDGLFDAAAALARPVSLLANVHTSYLWGGQPSVGQILGYLFSGSLQAGHPADWQVGHFVCLIGAADGPSGRLYAVADTYPSLGSRGIHVQPRELLAAALERREQPAGGVIVAAFAEDAPAIRSAAAALGLVEEIWDNGTPEREPAS